MINDWYSGAVIWRWSQEDVLEVWVMGSTSVDPRYAHQSPQTKFVGGMKGSHNEDLTPRHTLARKVRLETGLSIKRGFAADVLHVEQDDGDPDKFFYDIPWTQLYGEPRLKPIVIEKDRLSPLVWVAAGEVDIYSTHRAPLDRLVEKYGLRRDKCAV